jgi:hypothetical protein
MKRHLKYKRSAQNLIEQVTKILPSLEIESRAIDASMINMLISPELLEKSIKDLKKTIKVIEMLDKTFCDIPIRRVIRSQNIDHVTLEVYGYDNSFQLTIPSHFKRLETDEIRRQFNHVTSLFIIDYVDLVKPGEIENYVKATPYVISLITEYIKRLVKRLNFLNEDV